jgi:hypothetical protein
MFNMFNSKRLLASIAMIAFAAVAVTYWFRGHGAPSSPIRDTGLTKEHLASVPKPRDGIEVPLNELSPAALPSSQSAPSEPHADAQAVPSEDISDSVSLQTLAERAMEGHPTAACRLFVRATQCTSLNARRSLAQQMEGVLTEREASKGDEFLIRAIAQLRGKDSIDVACAGMGDAETPDADEYLARSVAAMSTRQRVLLVMMRPDGSLVRLPRQPDNTIRTGRGSDYLIPQILADNFQRFLQEGVAASDPIALEGLILLHAPGYLPGASNGLSSAIPDPQKFAHAALLMQVLYGPDALGPAVDAMLAQTLSRMNPALRHRVEAEVTARAAIWSAAPSSAPESQPLSEGDTEALCAE